MTTAVLDTNVLAAGFVSPELAPGQLLIAWQYGLFELVTSPQIIAELARTFEQPYFRLRLSEARRQANLDLLRFSATSVIPTAEVARVATHPEDDGILAAAVSANADYLVTGDRQLHRLEIFRGVAIVSPRQFVEVLSAES